MICKIDIGINNLKYLQILFTQYHKDYFAHMIQTQAKYENMIISYRNKIFKNYLTDTIVI